jgi:hypothetical protein
MLEYVEGQQEARTGIGRMGQGIDTNALKGGPMTATEVSVMSQGRNARAEMIARIFAETGVKDLFKIILGLLVKYQPRARMVRLRNQWVDVDPSGWSPEMDVEISVGLGMGDKTERLAVASAILQDYASIVQSPFASMVGPTQVYNALKMKLNAADVKNVDDFLIEPQEGEEQPEQPDPAAMEAQAKMAMEQAKLEGEQRLAEMRIQLKAQEQEAAQQLAREKAEFEATLAREKAQFEAELAEWKARQQQAYAMSDNRPGGDLDK